MKIVLSGRVNAKQLTWTNIWFCFKCCFIDKFVYDSTHCEYLNSLVLFAYIKKIVELGFRL